MLALALGRTVQEIEDGMSARECAEWARFYAQEPFGDLRADLRAGIIASTVASVNGSKPMRPRDFMPFADAGMRAPVKAGPRDDGARAAFLMASGNLPRRVVRRRAPAAPTPPRTKR